jgi:DNA-binding MarR family transcriptional regulator
MPSENDRQEKQVEKLSQFPCLCAVIRKTGRSLTKQYDNYLKPSGLKVTQYSMLVNIMRNPGIAVTELAKLLLMDQTTVTRNLRVLEKTGYISMNPDGSDSRVKRIRITDIGQAKVDEAKPYWETAQLEMVRILGREEIDHILASLNNLLV